MQERERESSYGAIHKTTRQGGEEKGSVAIKFAVKRNHARARARKYNEEREEREGIKRVVVA